MLLIPTSRSRPPGRVAARRPGAHLENWRRNYLAVWPSLFAVSMGLMAFVPSLPLYLQERFAMTDPAELRLWAGLVFGAAPFAAALFGPLWGAIGDRHGRKPMALRAILGIAAVTFVMPWADTPYLLTLLRFAQGVLAGYVAPAMALVSADLPAERQGATIGRLQVAMALGLLVGPALGAEVAAMFGREAVFWATSLLACLAAVPIVLFAREDRARLRAERPAGLLGGVRGFLGQRTVVLLLTCFFLMRFGQMMVEAFLALWVDHLGPLPLAAEGAVDRAHAVDRTTALLFIVYALGQVLFTAWWGRRGDRHGPLRSLTALSIGLALVLCVSGLVRSIEGFVVLRCFAAFFMAGSMSLTYAAAAKRVQSGSRSLAFAFVQSCMQLGMCLGPLAGGLLSPVIDLAGLFLLAGATLAVAAVVMVLLRARERAAESAARERAAAHGSCAS